MPVVAALTRNWPLKVVSLCLAVLLWLVAAAEEPSRRSVPVELTVEPLPGWTITRPAAPVRATVSGPGRELLKLSSSRIRLIKTLTDTGDGTHAAVELAASDVELPKGTRVDVQDVQPRRVMLEIARDSRALAAPPEGELERSLGQVPLWLTSADAASLTPERDSVEVIVRGPRTRIEALGRDSVTAVASLPPVAQVRGVARVRVLVPTGIVGWARPDTLSVRVRGPGAGGGS